MTDPFVDPGSGILRNNWGLRDPDELARRETYHSAKRMQDLPKTALTFAGYRKLHRHIFQDVYPWAGEIRSTALSKGGARGGVVLFLPPRLIEANLRQVFREIGEGRALRHLPPDGFAAAVAPVLDRVNHIHAFREGNGRAQRALLWRMGQVAGHEIDLRRILRDGWMAACIASDRAGDHRPMQDLIRGAIVGTAAGA